MSVGNLKNGGLGKYDERMPLEKKNRLVFNPKLAEGRWFSFLSFLFS